MVSYLTPPPVYSILWCILFCTVRWCTVVSYLVPPPVYSILLYTVQYTMVYIVLYSEVVYSGELPGPPTCLQLFYNDGGDKGDQVIIHISPETKKLSMESCANCWQTLNDLPNFALTCLANLLPLGS